MDSDIGGVGGGQQLDQVVRDAIVSDDTRFPGQTIEDLSGRMDYQDALLAAIPSATGNADALLDRASAVDGYTVRQLLRIVGAALAGKSSGGSGDDVVRAIDDSKDRITVEVDSNGHRTSVTVDAT